MFEMPSFPLRESIVFFDNQYYCRIDKIAMDFLTLTNIFLCHDEINC